MQAVLIARPGGPEVLQLGERPRPIAGPGEVLIKVAAAGVNRPDVMQREGNYAPPPGVSDIPGLEVAGEIVALGDGAARYRLGDAVMALVAGGGYAQYCVAPEATTLPIPAGLTMTEAAGVPETFFTVWTNVFQRGALKAGETLLVHGGSSGIGVTAIMLARALGAKVIATVGSAKKVQACAALGAAPCINYRDEDFVEATLKATNGRGADVILDMVGGAYVARNCRAAAEHGRIVQIAFLHGRMAELDLFAIMAKRLTLTGSTLRPRSIAEKGAIADALREKLWPLLAAGQCKPIIDSVFDLSDAASAHRRIEDPEHIGKIILKAP